VPRRSLLEFAREQYARRQVRYTLVSVIAVAVGQTVLIFCSVVLNMDPVPANVVAVAIGSIPSYLLNRIWVWGRRGNHQFMREVVPFWIMAFIGLAFSTLLVHYASLWSDSPLVINAANLVAFGSLWVIKYLILDSVMFGKGHHPGDEVVEEPALV
jgi:putative flippase GtrA